MLSASLNFQKALTRNNRIRIWFDFILPKLWLSLYVKKKKNKKESSIKNIWYLYVHKFQIHLFFGFSLFKVMKGNKQGVVRDKSKWIWERKTSQIEEKEGLKGGKEKRGS